MRSHQPSRNAAETADSENRQKRRKQTLASALLTVPPGATAIDCTIRDISDTGARVSMAKVGALPDSFFLINIRDRIAYEVTLAWRNETEGGLHFTRVMPLNDIQDPALGFLKKLWLARATR